MSVGIQPAIGTGFLWELLRDYSEQHAKVTVEFVDDVPPAEQVSRIQKRRLDIIHHVLLQLRISLHSFLLLKDFEPRFLF